MKQYLCLILVLILICGCFFNQDALSQSYSEKSSCTRIIDSCIAVDEEVTSFDLFEECKACCISESKSSRCINRCISKCERTFQPEKVTHSEFRAVELQETMLGVPLDVPIDFLRTNMVDSFKIRFTSSDEQSIITARKSGISPLLKVSVQNNGQQLLVLLNFQTSNLSALNLKPYQITNENGAEVHKFQIKGVQEKYFVPGAITLFVFVPKAAKRTGKFTLTTTLEDLSAPSTGSSTSGGITTSGGANCRMFQGTLMCEPTSSSGGSADLDTYVIIDGPNAGTVLYANGPSVLNNDNPVTNANGIITEAMPVTPEAGCDAQHFHGILFGIQDNGMCGHGKVKQVKALTAYLDYLSQIIKSEKDAMEKIKEPNYQAALQNLESVRVPLLQIGLDFTYTMADLVISPEQFMILQEKYDCIDKKDAEAKTLLANLRDNKAKLFDEVKASKLIESAIRCKLKILATALKIEKKRK